MTVELNRAQQKQFGIRLPKLAKLTESKHTDKELVFELRVPRAGKITQVSVNSQ